MYMVKLLEHKKIQAGLIGKYPVVKQRKPVADKKYVSPLNMHFLCHFAQHHPQMPDPTGI